MSMDADHAIITKIRDIAKDHGWAIGVHGSLERDIDLIAVPWSDTACDLDALLLAIAAGTDLLVDGVRYMKPHRRVGVLLFHKDAETDRARINRGEMAGPPHPKGRWFPPAVDLSMVDPREGHRD